MNPKNQRIMANELNEYQKLTKLALVYDKGKHEKE